MLGALLALSSAATFGATSAALRRGVLGGTILQGLAITIPLGVPLFAGACLVAGAFGTLFGFSAEDWAWLSATGAFHFVCGRYANFRATRALGATQVGPIQYTSGLIALVLALVFLDEKLTPLSATGAALVLTGPLIIILARMRQGEAKTRSGLTLNYVEGYFWGAVSAVVWGVSPLFVRSVIGGGIVRDGLAAGFVSYLAAAVAIGLIIVLAGKVDHVRSVDRNASRWFVATGTFVFCSQMLRYMALAVAPVSVVAPIQQMEVVFRLLFSWLINRDHEVFGASALIGITISGLGVLALTVSADLLVELVPLPPALVDFIRLEWP